MGLNCMEVWGGRGETEQAFEMPGMDVWVWSRRHGHHTVDGGDVHFLSSCASGRVTRMLMADICGRGPVFVELAAELRQLMLRNANSIRQSRFVRTMHQRLRSFSDRGGFATAVIGTYYAPTKSLHLCNAGHPLPLIYRAASGTWSVVKSPPTSVRTDDEVPLGVLDQREYQQCATRLETGDMVLGYSNVWTECRGRDGNVMGVDGMLRLMEQVTATRPADILATLAEFVDGEKIAEQGENDATMILCQATDRAVGWRNNLLAPFRLFGAVRDNTRLE